VLIRSDPLTMLDRLLSQVQPGTATGTGGAREAAMPLDAFRGKDGYVVEFDVPGVAPDDIEVTVERSALRVSATRHRSVPDGAEAIMCERPEHVAYSRQIALSEDLDSERIQASYENGVLRLAIPVSERAQPRRIQVGGSKSGGEAIDVGSADSQSGDGGGQIDLDAQRTDRAGANA
jgi:HSP20 family protein